MTGQKFDERLGQWSGQLDQLREFTEARKGWTTRKVFPSGEDYFGVREYAEPTFVRIYLLARRYDQRRPWQAIVARTAGMDDVEDQTQGRFDVVEEWISDWEKTLALPKRLAECKTRWGARQAARQARTKDITRLAFLEEIVGDLSFCRRQLADRFGPKNGRW